MMGDQTPGGKAGNGFRAILKLCLRSWFASRGELGWEDVDIAVGFCVGGNAGSGGGEGRYGSG